MIITAVRHTSVNVPSGICYGITDVPLAPTFLSELESIRRNLTSEPFDAIFSSPLSRCTKLANELFPEGPIRIDDRLTELDFGDWEMQPWDSVFSSSEGKTWFQDYTRASSPNGESFPDLVSRVKSFLDELREFENEQIAIISHAGVIRALMCLLQEKSAEEAFNTPLKYGQIVHFDFMLS